MSDTSKTTEKLSLDPDKFNAMLTSIINLEKRNFRTNALTKSEMLEAIMEIIRKEAEKCY